MKRFFILSLLAISFTSQASNNLTPMIVGGAPAEKGEFPFLVSIQNINSSNQSFSHNCGGSLIKKNWVLTAAHCLTKTTGSYKMILGLQDRTDYKYAEIFDAKKIIRHPKYNNSTSDYDYALIQLNGDSSYEPIELNNEEIKISKNPNKDSLTAWAAGWGLTSPKEFELPLLLNKVELPLVHSDICNAKKSYDGMITNRMMCAGYAAGKKDSCQSDSGGPLFFKKTDGSFLQIGVISWGDSCARPNKYGVYAKVNTVINWITEETK